MAAVAQSARVSATRDCLPVGQSQLRAPDQALGERTNKCSRARIPSLGVTTGGDSGCPRSRPYPPSLARRGVLSPLPSAPSSRATSPDSYQTFLPSARDPGLRGLPACPFSWFHLEPLPGLGASSPPSRGPPSLSSLFGEGLSTFGEVSEGHQRHARFSISPLPGYNFQEKLPPG